MTEIGVSPNLRFCGAPQQDLLCVIKLCVGHIFELRALPANI